MVATLRDYRRHRWLVIPLILLFIWLALDSLVNDSPTMDEQNHIARGLAFLRSGDPRLSLEHPPLVNSLSALPLLTMPDIRLPLDHPSWEQPQGWYAFAEQLLWVYNHDVERMVFLARLPIVLLTLVLALVAYHFARALWGRVAAFLSMVFVLFDPNILAHGRYSTTDLGGTLFIFLAMFVLWRLWRVDHWAWGRWLAAVLGLGLAFGSKLSSLAFVPIFALLAILPLYGPGRWWPAAGRRFLQLLSAGLLSVVVVWVLFAFEWGEMAFQSERLVSLNHFGGPMPTFWAGIEQILLLSGGGRPTFLLGRFSTEGFLAYFPVAFLSKTPLVTLALTVLAAVWLIVWPVTRRRALFLLLPAGFYFLLSMQSGLNIGYRHLLPILPMIYVLIGGLGRMLSVPEPAERLEHRWLAPLLLAGLASLVALDVWLHPHYLSYFNLAAGGPTNGHNILIDSNIDWGQDLLRLQNWMANNQVDSVKLAWFGSADPGYYGIQYEPLPGLPHHFDLWWDVPFNSQDPPSGTYAISVSNLWELPLEDKTVFAWFRARPPDDRVGYSILIYRVGGHE
jgi:hypothetical protein